MFFFYTNCRINFFLFFLTHTIQKRIIDILKGFSNNFILIKGPSQLFAVIFYSLTLWCLTAFQTYILGLSMGISLTFLATFFILILLCLNVTLPLATGYIGTFHVPCQYGLIFYSFSKEKALSMAILLYAAGFAPTIILGSLLFLLHHISVRNLTNK